MYGVTGFQYLQIDKADFKEQAKETTFGEGREKSAWATLEIIIRSQYNYYNALYLSDFLSVKWFWFSKALIYEQDDWDENPNLRNKKIGIIAFTS